MIEEINKFREYLDYIEEHYNNVQKAWKLIQSKCKDSKFIYDDFCFFMIDSDVKKHDDSKLSTEEFTQYRQFFFPTSEEQPDEDIMLGAWKHHIKKNVHHSDGWYEKNLMAAPYAEVYIVMLTVDLVAMAFKFGGTAKEYYDSHKDSIHVPKWGEELMYDIFKKIY